MPRFDATSRAGIRISGRNVMFSKSSMSLRRISVIALTLLFVGSICFGGAEAQTAPVVTASFAQGINHPSGWGAIQQTAVDSYGDWLVLDVANGALYEFPAGGGSVITLVAAGGVGSGNNPGIAIDPGNNLYLEANWNNCMMEFPYDTSTQSWDGLSSLTSSNPTSGVCPNSTEGTSPNIFAHYNLSGTGYPGYFQPMGIAIGNNDNMIVGAQNSGNFIFSLAVSGAWSDPAVGPVTILVAAMQKPASSVAQDKFGNVYFVEASGGLPGVYEIPAGETGLASDADPSIVRVDPNLPSVSGVITDSSGNLYVSDATDGVFMIPNPSGTPETSSAVSLTTVPAQGEVAIDWTRDIMYVPTTQTQSNGEADVAEVLFDEAEFGAAAIGGTPAQQSVSFGFGARTTPGSFQIVESGTANPDFAIASGGTCTAGTADAAQSNCSVNVTFNPQSAGSISAKLLMLDGSGNILASIPLHGTGTGAAVQFEDGTQSVIGAGLKTPSQVAVDAAGNVYVADSGLGAVEEYPAGSGATAAATTVGTGLSAPTGVAVDGTGDVFIADSGNVYEVPQGANGLNAAGQTTLTTGLGSNLKLAVDGRDNLYVLDPNNQRVVELSNIGSALGSIAQSDITGFNTPSAIAVDTSGNLYVADGSNLDEVPAGGGTITTLLSSLSTASGLAVDASGAVYVSMTGGTLRIPNESGKLNAADETTFATNVTAPASLALDAQGDLYVLDGTALNVNVTSTSTAYNFGTQATVNATASQTFTLSNAGNAAMNITGFTSTPDYSATATDCTGGAVAVNGTCTVTVTFNPGPGDDGTLTGLVAAQGNIDSAPAGVMGTGVGFTLIATTTTMTSGGAATTDNAPISVAVAPASGTAASLTGEVTLTISGNGITPMTNTVPIADGAAQFDPQNLLAGNYTFTVTYSGDRTYRHSSASAAVTVAAGAVIMTQPTSVPAQFQPFTMPAAFQSAYGSGTGYLVLGTHTGSDWVYSDGSGGYWNYMYTTNVTAANGDALTCQPVDLLNPGKAPSFVAQNCGSVTYQPASGNVDCPNNGGTSDQVAVTIPNGSVVGSATLDVGCLDVNDSNTTIPDLMTFFSVTPTFSGTDIYYDQAATATQAAVNYTGNVNPNYASATGTAINFWVLRNPVVQISSSATSLSVAPGSSAQATLTLTSLLGYGYLGRGSTLNNYGTPLDLQCDGLPAYASCTFTYSTPIPSDPNALGALCAGSTTQYCSVNVGPDPGTTFGNGTTCEASDGCIGPGTVVMTITTNNSTGAVSSLRTDRGSLAFAALFGLGLLGLSFRRKAKRWGGLLLLVCITMCGAGMFGITACGTTNLTPASTAVTPAGSYNVTVTAKESGFICTYNTQAGHATVAPCPAGSSDAPTWGNGNQMSLPYAISLTVQK